MSAAYVRLHGVEYKLSHHLKFGGDIKDSIGRHIVSEFINEFISIPSKHSVTNDCSNIVTILKIRNQEFFDLSIKDLETILVESISATLPNAWVKYYEPEIILGTILFFEPLRLYQIQTELKIAELKIENNIDDGQELNNGKDILTPEKLLLRENVLINFARKTAIELKNEIDAKNGASILKANCRGIGLSEDLAKSDWFEKSNSIRNRFILTLILIPALYDVYRFLFN